MVKFLHYKMLAIFLILGLFVIISHDTAIDSTLMSWIYSSNDGFKLQNNFWLEKVFHKGGVLFVGAIGLGILIRVLLLIKIYSQSKSIIHKEKRFELTFVFSSVLISVLLIKYLKSITTLPCPWNMKIYGGTREFQSFWSLFNYDHRIGYCFPSGHASAGYGFLSLYFAKSLHQKPDIKYFYPGILLGLVYGLTQQFRGAHFLSHDLGTILLCLWIPWSLSFIIFIYKTYKANPKD